MYSVARTVLKYIKNTNSSGKLAERFVGHENNY